MKKLSLFILLIGCGLFQQARGADKLAVYQYEDTRRLVKLVEDAAALVEKKGDAAFQEFGVRGSKWLNEQHYLFAYTLDGRPVFHPMEPGLVGKDLSKFRDLEGKPVVALVTDIGRKTQPDASGWVFYLWEDPRSNEPLWKSSYIRKVITPDGKVYVIGSGLYNMKTEKVFVQERVDMAVDLILKEGKEVAFEKLRKSSSPLYVADSSITVIDEDGNIVVDPAFPTLVERNCFTIRDKSGRAFTIEAKKKLENVDQLWLQYSWIRADTKRPARKLAYIRKIRVEGKVYYVMGDFFPPTPIWMRQ